LFASSGMWHLGITIQWSYCLYSLSGEYGWTAVNVWFWFVARRSSTCIATNSFGTWSFVYVRKIFETTCASADHSITVSVFDYISQLFTHFSGWYMQI
jgi:hypothetical protein